MYPDRPNKVGVDGLALTADRSTLYYTPLTSRKLYAIDTPLLMDFDTPIEEIASSVQLIGEKSSNSDGMYADNQGNVWYTMLEGLGAGKYSPADDQFVEFVSDDRMIWVDGLAFDQKGSIIFNSNRLHEMFGEPYGLEGPDWTDPYNLIVWKAYVGEGVKSYLYAD